jgi:type I restriction enzyme S subunit
VCLEIVDCVNRTAPQSAAVTSYIMLRTSNIKSGKISLEDVKYVEKQIFDIWTRRSLPQRGDILVSATQKRPKADGIACPGIDGYNDHDGF